MRPSVSVIICTYNRAPLLKRALFSLTRQTLLPRQFEVIVVDDASQDKTAQICEMMRAELPNLKYISTDTNSGVGRARNQGIDAASGNHLLFLDDDCIAVERWIERFRGALNREPIVAGAVRSPIANYFQLCHNIAQFHAVMPGQKAGPIELLAGANMAFRRSVLEELNGFQKSRAYADDWELILRARKNGYRVFFEPEAIVTHNPDRTTLTSILKYSAEHAAITIHLRNRYRSLLRTPSVFRFPTFILAAAPVLALKATAGIYLSNPTLAKLFWTAPIVYATKIAWCWGAARGLRNHRSAPPEI